MSFSDDVRRYNDLVDAVEEIDAVGPDRFRGRTRRFMIVCEEARSYLYDARDIIRDAEQRAARFALLRRPQWRAVVGGAAQRGAPRQGGDRVPQMPDRVRQAARQALPSRRHVRLIRAACTTPAGCRHIRQRSPARPISSRPPSANMTTRSPPEPPQRYGSIIRATARAYSNLLSASRHIYWFWTCTNL
jgi:hypothetical protein